MTGNIWNEIISKLPDPHFLQTYEWGQVKAKYGWQPIYLVWDDKGNMKEERIDVVESGFEFPRSEHCPQSLYDDQLKYFVGCVQKNQKPNPGGLEGLMNMKVVDAAYESSKSGKVVSIK